MLKKKSFCIIGIVIAVCLLLVAAIFYAEETKAISGVALGVGMGLLGSGIANLIRLVLEDKNPEIKRQNAIEEKDERNIIINTRAKAAAADIVQWFIIGITYITILIKAPLWLTLVTVGVYSLYHILTIAFMSKYQREM